MVTGLELKRDVVVVGNHTAMATGAIQAPGTIAALWGRDPAQGGRSNPGIYPLHIHCNLLYKHFYCMALHSNILTTEYISCAL